MSRSFMGKVDLRAGRSCSAPRSPFFLTGSAFPVQSRVGRHCYRLPGDNVRHGWGNGVNRTLICHRDRRDLLDLWSGGCHVTLIANLYNRLESCIIGSTAGPILGSMSLRCKALLVPSQREKFMFSTDKRNFKEVSKNEKTRRSPCVAGHYRGPTRTFQQTGF